MGRSAAVLLFVAAVAAIAAYCAQRPTVARGTVMADQLAPAVPGLQRLDCQDRIPIGMAGATFSCTAVFINGNTGPVQFRIDREGQISVVGQ